MTDQKADSLVPFTPKAGVTVYFGGRAQSGDDEGYAHIPESHAKDLEAAGHGECAKVKLPEIAGTKAKATKPAAET